MNFIILSIGYSFFSIPLNFSVIKGWFHYKSRAFAILIKVLKNSLKNEKRYQKKNRIKKIPLM